MAVTMYRHREAASADLGDARRMIGPLLARGALLVTLAVGLSAAAAPSKPVLMVVYFDNLTGKSEHDVMRKGLADMIITDLVAYDGVTVVERDKLEAVL